MVNLFILIFPDLKSNRNKYQIKMAQGDQQQFCLRWNDFQTNMVSSFKHLRDEKSFTDVTLACDGQTCKAHKMVLSACSPYFKVSKSDGLRICLYSLPLNRVKNRYMNRIAKKSNNSPKGSIKLGTRT